MQCKRCQSTKTRTPSINSRSATQTVRKRVCQDCGNTWFSVEIVVPDFAVGWSAIGGGGSKPVLRVPIDVTLQHVEEVDRTALCRSTVQVRQARRDLTVTECDSPAN